MIKSWRRFNEKISINDLTLEEMNNILVDIIDDGFVISGPYTVSDSCIQFFVDKGISEEEAIERGMEAAVEFKVSDIETPLRTLVDYTGLEFDFILGTFLWEDNNFYSIDELFTNRQTTSLKDMSFNNSKITYIIIRVVE